MMMIPFIYKRIALLSPKIEVMLRQVYWRNVKHLKKFNPNRIGANKKPVSNVDFDEIINWLNLNNIGSGSLLIVHSSYDSLECTGLSSEQIIGKLLELVGPSGTLAMPAIRRFKEAPKYYDEIADNLVCKYIPRKTMITSGMLPYTLLHKEGSEVSRHPFNPMVAYGPLAKSMMEHNLEGEYPAPHGPNSSWKFCYDHGAKVIGLGVNLYHYNTICHVNEEAFGNWRFSDEEWYRLRKFRIIDGDFDEIVTVRERKPEWGMLRLAELNSSRDLDKYHLITHKSIGGIDVYLEDASALIDHLQDNVKNKVSFYV